MSRLRSDLTTLRNLRHGFIEQHGSEPSVSLKYSEQSSSNSTISLRVGNSLDPTNDSDEFQKPSTSGSEKNQKRTNDNKENVRLNYLFILIDNETFLSIGI